MGRSYRPRRGERRGKDRLYIYSLGQSLASTSLKMSGSLPKYRISGILPVKEPGTFSNQLYNAIMRLTRATPMLLTIEEGGQHEDLISLLTLWMCLMCFRLLVSPHWCHVGVSGPQPFPLSSSAWEHVSEMVRGMIMRDPQTLKSVYMLIM